MEDIIKLEDFKEFREAKRNREIIIGSKKEGRARNPAKFLIS
jgi:hypothetical protein